MFAIGYVTRICYLCGMKENAMLFANTDLRFVNKEITPFGGLSLFFKMLERCRFDEVLDGCVCQFATVSL